MLLKAVALTLAGGTGFIGGMWISLEVYTIAFRVLDRVFKPTDPYLIGPVVGGLVAFCFSGGVLTTAMITEYVNRKL